MEEDPSLFALAWEWVLSGLGDVRNGYHAAASGPEEAPAKLGAIPRPAIAKKAVLTFAGLAAQQAADLISKVQDLVNVQPALQPARRSPPALLLRLSLQQGLLQPLY